MMTRTPCPRCDETDYQKNGKTHHGPLPAVTPPYTAGYQAARRGEPLDACRYRQPERRNAWVRGWHQGQADQVKAPLTPAEQASGRAHLQPIKQRLSVNRRAEGQDSTEQDWLSQEWVRGDGRYYRAYLQPDLFGIWVLISVWGMRGTELGRIRHTPCASYAEGLARLEAVRTRRRQHGYRELTA